MKKTISLGVRVSEEMASQAHDALLHTNSETLSRFFRSCLDDLIVAHEAGERIVEPVHLARQPSRRKPTLFAIFGAVISKTKDGIIIFVKRMDENFDSLDARVNSCSAGGTLFVVGHPQQLDLADGDYVRIVGAPQGNFEYTTVTGAGATIHSYRFVEQIEGTNIFNFHLASQPSPLTTKRAQPPGVSGLQRIGGGR